MPSHSSDPCRMPNAILKRPGPPCTRGELPSRPLRRGGATGMYVAVRLATEAVTHARTQLHSVEQAAAPYVARVVAAQARADEAERAAGVARMRQRLDRLTTQRPSPGLERARGL